MTYYRGVQRPKPLNEGKLGIGKLSYETPCEFGGGNPYGLFLHGAHAGHGSHFCLIITGGMEGHTGGTASLFGIKLCGSLGGGDNVSKPSLEPLLLLLKNEFIKLSIKLEVAVADCVDVVDVLFPLS